MNAKYTVLSIDIGTSTVKCGILDESGSMISGTRVAVSLPPGKHPAAAWEESCMEAFGQLSGLLSTVCAVTICGNGPTIIPVDSRGVTCGPAVSWNSRHSSRIEGTRSLFLPAAARVMELDPGISRRVRWYSGCPEYITGKMTGQWRTFLPSKEFSPFIWGKEEAGAYQVPFELLPAMIPMGDTVGEVEKAYSLRSGIPAGIPVFAGGPDYLLALLGTAVTVPGRVCDRAGTSEGLNLCIAAADYEAAVQAAEGTGLRILPHCIGGLYSAAAMLPVSGMHFLTFLRAASARGIDADALARDIFSVCCLDDSLEPALRRALDMVGSDALSEDHIVSIHGETDWVMTGRLLSEAIGFTVRRGLDRLKFAGYEIDSVRISGGQALNYGWNQLKADLINTAIEVPEIVDAELLGCAAVSLNSLGQYPSLQESCEILYRRDCLIEPGKQRARKLSEKYARIFTPPSLQK